MCRTEHCLRWRQADRLTRTPSKSPDLPIIAHESYDFNGEGEIYAWYLLNPAVAGPANVSISYALSRNHDTLCQIFVLQNMVQQAPGTDVYSSGTGVTKTISSISAVVGDLVWAVHGLANNISSPSAGTGGTILLHQYYASTQESSYLSSIKKAKVASESRTHNWTTSRDFGMGAFAMTGYPPGGGGATWLMSRMQDFYDELKRGLIAPDLLKKRYAELFV